MMIATEKSALLTIHATLATAAMMIILVRAALLATRVQDVASAALLALRAQQSAPAASLVPLDPIL